MTEYIYDDDTTRVTISDGPDDPDITLYTRMELEWPEKVLAFLCRREPRNMFKTGLSFKTDEDIEYLITALKDLIQPTTFTVQRVLPEAIMPTKAHSTDVGWDLHIPANFNLMPGETKRVDFGIVVGIQPGYEIQVRNRSGIVWKYSVMVPLGVGTCDRGHIMAPFYNFGTEMMNFSRGDRLAQMVMKKVEDVRLVEGTIDTNTPRGNGSFGSTGV